MTAKAPMATPSAASQVLRLPRHPPLIETGFYLRCRDELRHAVEEAERIAIFAPPGYGKTRTARAVAASYGGFKRPAQTQAPVIYVPLAKGERINAQRMRRAIRRELGAPSPDSAEQDDTLRLADQARDIDVGALFIDDADNCDLDAFDVLRGMEDVYDAAKVPLAVVLLVAQVRPRATDSPPWPLLTGDSPVAWQCWRRLTVRHPVVIAGHNHDEVGSILASLTRLYRPRLPLLDLERWTDVLWQGLIDYRVDRLHTGRVGMDEIWYVVRESIKEAIAAGRRDLDPRGGRLHAVIDELQRHGPRPDA